MGDTIFASLAQHDKTQPAVIVPGGPTLTYGDVDRLVDEAAARLVAAGITRGDRVALALPNGPESLLLFLAVARVATACPLNPAYTKDEFRFYLEDTGARCLVAPSGIDTVATEALAEGGIVVRVDLDAAGRWSVEAPHRVAAAEAPDPRADDVALVLHTSGTTGRPKRVPLSHGNLSFAAEVIRAHYTLEAQDVTVCVMPLFHIHGLVASAIATLISGGTVVVPRNPSPLAFWPLVRAVGLTWFSASPSLHKLVLMRAPRDAALHLGGLRFVRSCSAAMAPEQVNEMEACFGAPLIEAYGMTEACHQMASNPLPPAPRVLGSVGQPTGTEIAVMDDAGRLLPAGSSAEVAVRGPSVMAGYEGNPEANAASFAAGWFRTGDRGRLDDEGFLTLEGRIKELINRGGEKVSPVEVDRVLESHPRIREAVTFGVPHPVWGEEVAAVIVASDQLTEKEVIAYCRERLVSFKVPQRIYFVDVVPRTPTGKVQRRAVAAAIAESE